MVQKQKKNAWHAETNMQERKKMMPDHCFLLPTEKKYPVCAKKTNKVSCRGLEAAYRRAKQQHRNDIAEKAKTLGQLYCDKAHRPGRSNKKKKKITSKKTRRGSRRIRGSRRSRHASRRRKYT